MLEVEVGMMWPQARGCWCLQTLEEGRRWISLEPPSGTSPSSACKTELFWTCDLQNHRITNVCCSGLLQLCGSPCTPSSGTGWAVSPGVPLLEGAGPSLSRPQQETCSAAMVPGPVEMDSW